MDYIHKTFWENKNVLLTGHTGFKGAWLFHLLKKLKVKVTGYSLAQETNPSLFQGLEYHKDSYIGDLRDIELLSKEDLCTLFYLYLLHYYHSEIMIYYI